jgi:hypothetical protein
MSREAHVRFWESAGVQFPRATQPKLNCREASFEIFAGKQEITAPHGESAIRQALLTAHRSYLLDDFRFDVSRVFTALPEVG